MKAGRCHRGSQGGHGTSNSSMHFHSVVVSAARRLSRRMRVRILTHATEEGVVFLVTFPGAKARGC